MKATRSILRYRSHGRAYEAIHRIEADPCSAYPKPGRVCIEAESLPAEAIAHSPKKAEERGT